MRRERIRDGFDQEEGEGEGNSEAVRMMEVLVQGEDEEYLHERIHEGTRKLERKVGEDCDIRESDSGLLRIPVGFILPI